LEARQPPPSAPPAAPVHSDFARLGRRDRTRVQNRQAILEAARRVFAEFGYGATTVRDIIRATSLASGTFYNYFKSKEEVFQAIRDEAALRVRPRLREERVRAGTLEGFISGTFRTFFEYVASDQANFTAIRRNETLRVRVDTPEIIAGFEELREDIELGISRGVFPPIDAEFLMAAMVGVAFEMADEMLKSETPNPEDAAQFATALFMGGIARLPKKPEPIDKSAGGR